MESVQSPPQPHSPVLVCLSAAFEYLPAGHVHPSADYGKAVEVFHDVEVGRLACPSDPEVGPRHHNAFWNPTGTPPVGIPVPVIQYFCATDKMSR